jgi:hypothetical protein
MDGILKSWTKFWASNSLKPSTAKTCTGKRLSSTGCSQRPKEYGSARNLLIRRGETFLSIAEVATERYRVKIGDVTGIQSKRALNLNEHPFTTKTCLFQIVIIPPTLIVGLAS